MQDIVKAIKEAESKGGVNGGTINFTKETMISREYLNNEVLGRYPDLEFVRIFMKKTRRSWVYHDSSCESKYYFFSAFIIKDIFRYMLDDFKLIERDNQKVIDLTSYSWDEQLKLRDRILRICPIIVSEEECYYEDEERFIDWDSFKLLDNIYIYPHNFSIDDYELLNSTNFILISNSSFRTQKDLDDLCLQILEKLSQENQDVIAREKDIYMSISDKLKRNITLTKQEIEIIEQFLNSEMSRIDKENTLLVRSKKLDN